jgi:hypothetical protein
LQKQNSKASNMDVRTIFFIIGIVFFLHGKGNDFSPNNEYLEKRTVGMQTGCCIPTDKRLSLQFSVVYFT